MNYGMNGYLKGVHFPPISEVRSWVSECPVDKPLIDLCQAVPDYPPAPQMVRHLQQVVADEATSRYSPDEGLPEVREALAAWYRQRYAGVVAPENICLTAGASQAFWLAMVGLCCAGDEVVVQTPYYFDHPMALEMLGIQGKFLPYREGSRGLPDPEAVESLISTKTRAILLVTPSNPTGAVTPPEIIDELCTMARRRKVALILDETYGEFISGGAVPHRLFARPDWEDSLVHIKSFGKTYALTGYRAGCLVASRQLIQQVLKIQDTMLVCQPRITQEAIRYGVENLGDWVAGNCRMMEGRHDRFRELFTAEDSGFRLSASGSFFAWVRHPFPGASGRRVSKLLVQKRGLLTLPGEVFGPGLEGYLRLAFGNIGEEAIPEAVARFRGLV